jgi:hypothetical protein
MKNYITFGQIHVHSISGKTLDKDCVAVFESKDYDEGRKKVFEYFDGKFHNHYTNDNFDESIMKYYPRGLIEI